jgi:hypothetical protein
MNKMLNLNVSFYNLNLNKRIYVQAHLFKYILVNIVNFHKGSTYSQSDKNIYILF